MALLEQICQCFMKAIILKIITCLVSALPSNGITGDEYDNLYLYTEDSDLVDQTFYMSHVISKNGKAAINKYEVITDDFHNESSTQELTGTNRTLIEKKGNAGYQISYSKTLITDTIERNQDDVIEIKINLYNKQKEQIYDQTFQLSNKEATIYHGQKDGVSISHMRTGNTALLNSPDLRISMLALQEYKHYDTLNYHIEYLKNDVVASNSNTIERKDFSFMPYHQGTIEKWYRTYGSWADEVLDCETDVVYEEAALIITFQGRGVSDKTIRIPLEKAS